MVPDVSTGDPTKMLCLNCARRIVSPRSRTKYGSLTRYLRYRASFTNVVKLSLAKIDGIISDNLPMSAYREEKWWNNSKSSVHAKAWLNAGWRIRETNLDGGYVVFQKVRRLQSKKYRRKAFTKRVKKPFTPAPYRIPKKRKPSKTKVAKLYARIKNLERKRTSITKHTRGFKPKPAHEKRLFKSDEKPK